MSHGVAEEIVKWANTQPSWRRDALRRLLVGTFSKTDEDECFELLCAEHGVQQTKFVAIPVETKHLPVRAAAAVSLRLSTLDGIAHVNRLAPEAALAPAQSGITLIYGDNGSGKTGYCRITKKSAAA